MAALDYYGLSFDPFEKMSDALKWGIQMNHRTVDAEVMQRAIDSQSLL